MPLEDLQYLATPHPFGGLRIYTCAPQGLRNSSEQGFERLGRVYGDMEKDKKLVRMADGLYILANTEEQLLLNFKETLRRAKQCGMTFKPKKVVVAPVSTILFGWKRIGDGWIPTNHVVSPLSVAEAPTTAKRLRSWLGSYKQLVECIPEHAKNLKHLEKAHRCKKSREGIVWTEEMHNEFKAAKETLGNLQMVHTPRPSDQLHLYPDWSEDSNAIGGHCEIERMEDGKSIKPAGGHVKKKPWEIN